MHIFAVVRNTIVLLMKKEPHNNDVQEPSALTYGMSEELRDSGILTTVRDLSSKDKACLIRYIHGTENPKMEDFEDICDDMQSYTIEELNARIDESEAEIDRDEGKSFEEMMNGFKEKLLWLK